MSREIKKVGIVGLGLMGASMALAIKEHVGISVYGWDIDQKTLVYAKEIGAIDEGTQDFSQCDVIIIALYPGDGVAYVKEHGASFKSGAIVTDLCGVKEYVCDELGKFCQDNGLHFVGAHPMAGKETGGIVMATGNLYQQASVIITPNEFVGAEQVELVEWLFKQVGINRVIITTPQHHDEMISYTSQLAHVISSSYIQNPLAASFEGFASYTGGSFQDLTRIARLNSRMWTELFIRNDQVLCEQIDQMIKKLEQYKYAIESHDVEQLKELMENGAMIKEQLIHELEG